MKQVKLIIDVLGYGGLFFIVFALLSKVNFTGRLGAIMIMSSFAVAIISFERRNGDTG